MGAFSFEYLLPMFEINISMSKANGNTVRCKQVFIPCIQTSVVLLLIIYVLAIFSLTDVIMDMLNNSKMREAILKYYEESGDPKTVSEAIKLSQENEEETTDGGNDGFGYMLFGKKRYARDTYA